jgi:hypothetical protein
MSIVTTLQNAKTVDEVIDLINNSDVCGHSPEEIAAQYVMDADMENRKMNNLNMQDAYTEINLEIHLDTLIENGATFNYPKALSLILANN